MSASMSCHRVLNTEEMLEAILLQVDMQTLLTSCQRVNKTFKDAIAKSPRLQQKLFFQSAPPFNDNIDYVNPLIKKHQEKLGIHWYLDNLKIRFYEEISDLMMPDAIRTKSKVFAVYIMFKSNVSPQASSSPAASWKRMLPMQTGRKDRVWLVGRHSGSGRGLERYVHIVPRLYPGEFNLVDHEAKSEAERRRVSRYDGRTAISDWDFHERGEHYHFSPHIGFCNSMGRRATEPTMAEILEFVQAGQSMRIDEEDLVDGMSLRSQ